MTTISKSVRGLFAALVLAITPAFSQTPSATATDTPTLLIADNSSSGTYAVFEKQLADTVSEVVRFEELKDQKGGAIGNLDALLNNRAMAAFMHSDVLAIRAQSVPNLDQKFQTLLALYGEEVHFITLRESARTTGGTLGFGKKPVVFNTVDDLKSTIEVPVRVGAAGGGFISASVVRANGNLQYEVVQFSSGGDVIAALDKGEIDAAVFTGGAPLPNIEKLDHRYRLLPMSGTLIDQLSVVYHKASLTYNNIQPESVATVAADALLVAKVYKSPKFKAVLAGVRKSFYTNLDQLKETPGNHPKWSEVTEGNRGKWTYMSLPGDTAVPAVVDEK